jgi:molybdate transport system ATP-binding protein
MSVAQLALRLELARGDFVLRAEAELPLSGVTALFGASGSGKTSLLRCVAGLERRARGVVRFGGETWQDEKGRFVPPEQRGLGYVFQEPRLFPHLSVRENIAFGAPRSERRSARARASELAELLGITHLLERSVASLSGGEAQRVALGRALGARPRLLLLDEPLASLDDAGKQELLGALEALLERAPLPVLYVTHGTLEVARLADRVLSCVSGSVGALLPTAEALSELDPRAHPGEHLLSVLTGRLEGWDPVHRVAVYQCSGGSVRLPALSRPAAPEARIVVRSSDVALTLEPHARTSALNLVGVTVEAVRDLDEATVTLRCRFGDAPLLATLTRLSVAELGLAPGRQCYAQFKAAALGSPAASHPG